MHKYRLIFGCFLLLCMASVGWARIWTSPDGNISIDLPEDGSLTQITVPLPPETSQLHLETAQSWGNQENMTTISVVIIDEDFKVLNLDTVLAGMRRRLPEAEFDPMVAREVGNLTVYSFTWVFTRGDMRGRTDIWLNDGRICLLTSSMPIQSSQAPIFEKIYQSLKVKSGPQPVRLFQFMDSLPVPEKIGLCVGAALPLCYRIYRKRRQRKLASQVQSQDPTETQ